MKKERLVIIILTIIMISFLIIFYNNIEQNIEYDFKIYFFNAGKADAILLSKNDKYIMIDTGEESLSNEILTYFKNNNINKLDYLIITHFDKDHVGSASKIIDNIEVGKVIQSSYIKESTYYTNYINSLNNKNIEPEKVVGNYKIYLDDISIIINGPSSIYDSSESNNSSLIVSLTYNNNKFLFMGDSENPRIKDFISFNNDTYDFIKIPYHGNYLKRLNDLLNNTKSSYAVMTCSNSEGCANETIEILNNHPIKYYMTKDGAITILSDGNNIKIEQ